MKYLIILFLTMFLNGCAIYFVKCDCPQKEVVKERFHFEAFKPTLPDIPPYFPPWIDSIWGDGGRISFEGKDIIEPTVYLEIIEADR